MAGNSKFTDNDNSQRKKKEKVKCFKIRTNLSIQYIIGNNRKTLTFFKIFKSFQSEIYIQSLLIHIDIVRYHSDFLCDLNEQCKNW